MSGSGGKSPSPSGVRAGRAGRLTRLLAALRERSAVAGGLARLEGHEIADLGVTRSELHALTRAGNRSAELLSAMTRRLGVTAAMLDRAPETRRDIQRTCALCDAQRRCRRWLRRAGPAEGHRAFCPNAGSFAELRRQAAARGA